MLFLLLKLNDDHFAGMMKRKLLLLICLFFCSFTGIINAQKPVRKTNDLKVFMHYMPWYETPETIGRWGWHWTMNTQNPDNLAEGDRREIASHYYPLIGPYASRDKDVIEYHFLLMKLSGIDGVLINWYGVQGSNDDIEELLESANTIVSYVDDYGLEFGVVMEDRFSRTLEDVKANMAYLRENYFQKPAYMRVGAARIPFVSIFGPISFEEPEQWAAVMTEAGEDIRFLCLWHESDEAGAHAAGEYSWVYQDRTNHLDHLQNFYARRAAQLRTVMGSAYPGFHDFYKTGGAGDGYFNIPHNKGATLKATLAKAQEHREIMDMLQLVTWNDFGEGTIFEPTRETGFEYLKQVQAFTGVEYGEEELRLVYKLYRLRKAYSNEPEVQKDLDLASEYLTNLEIEKAAAMLNSMNEEI